MVAGLNVRESGIGQQVPGHRPLKGLLFVPRDTARTQSLAACAQLAPEVRTKSFVPSNGVKLLDSADLLVITYKGFLGLKNSDWDYLASQTDLWQLDEVHDALGSQVSQRLRDGMERYKPTTIGMSATPDFSEERTAKEILGFTYTINSMTPRESTETGVSNPVQLIAVQSGATLKPASRRHTLTEYDLAPLINNKPRNDLITSIMRSMGGLGCRGLVKCVPGTNNTHAQMIAHMGRKQVITDSQTGSRRLLRVEAVGGHRTDNREVIRAFKADKIDALTFSKYLLSAFDDDGIRYLIADTGSPVDMTQYVGRGGRLGDPRVTRIFCLIDKYLTQRKIYTPFDVFEQSMSYQTEIIAPTPTQSLARSASSQQAHRPTGKRQPNQTLYDSAVEGLEPEVINAIDAIPPGTVLEQALIARKEQRTIPDGYQELTSLPALVSKKVTAEGAAYRLRGQLGDDGQELLVNVRGADGVLRGYASPQAAALVERLYVFGRNVSRVAIQNFLTEQGWPPMSMHTLVAVCERQDIPYAVQKRMVRLELEPARSFLRSLAETPFVDPEREVQVLEVAREMGCSSSEAHRALLGRPGGPTYDILERRRGRAPTYYRIVGAVTLSNAVLLADAMLQNSPKVATASGGRSAESIVLKVQQTYQSYAQSNGYVPRLAAEAIDAFIATYTVPTEPDAIPPPSPLLDPRMRLSGNAHWRLEALCRDMDPEIFVADKGREVERAVSVCAECPVKADCLMTGFKGEDPGLKRPAKLYIDGTAGGVQHSDRKSLLPLVSKIEAWLLEKQVAERDAN